MTLSMYQASVPLFRHGFAAFAPLLDKAAAHAAAKKIDEAVFVQARLAPDMLPLSRQIQIASDGVKGCVGRLAGIEVPKMEDTEATFEELKARMAKTDAFIAGVTPEQIDGTEAKAIELKLGPNTHSFTGQDYLLKFVIPNFYFHLTTAYAILRHNGVEIGKRDFLGAIL